MGLHCPPAAAWNPLGHKVVCEIAWQQLEPETRKQIADTLKRHPRFAEDFAPQMPAEETDRWIFWQAGFWPDIARGIPEEVRDQYNKPTWHYVDHPVFLGPERPVDFNLDTAPSGSDANWNVYQATRHSSEIIKSDAPPQEKAVAYCWLFHLVGDMHQPLHCVALVCDRFPTGDKGGSILKVVHEKEDLHSLWDCLLGNEHTRGDKRSRSITSAIQLSLGRADPLAQILRLPTTFVQSAGDCSCPMFPPPLTLGRHSGLRRRASCILLPIPLPATERHSK